MQIMSCICSLIDFVQAAVQARTDAQTQPEPQDLAADEPEPTAPAGEYVLELGHLMASISLGDFLQVHQVRYNSIPIMQSVRSALVTSRRIMLAALGTILSW